MRSLTHNKPFLLSVNVVTLFSFLFTSVVMDLAWAAKAPIESDRAGSFDISSASVPLRFGDIQDTFKGTNGKTIIHIQDAHCNYAAQNSIDGIIRHLTSSYNNVNLVSLEGGRGNYDLSTFTDIQDPSIRLKVSDYFVKEGRVSGPEFFAINNPGKVKLFGIEDENLYKDNLNTYRSSLSYKEEVDKGLNTLSTAITNLKMKMYSPALKELDQKITDYKSNKIDFKDYIIYLSNKAKEANIDPNTYKTISGLVSILNDEKSINFKEADIERNKLIDKINKKVSKRDLEELVIKSAQFKMGDITGEEFYSYLFRKAKFSGVDFSTLPNLVKYSEYMKKYESLDKVNIFKEMKSIEDALFDKYADTDDQKTLRSLDRDLSIMKGIFNIALVKDEFDYYSSNKDNFRIKRFTDFINTKASLNGLNFKINNGIEKLDKYRENMEKFYQYSLKRDNAFIKNIEKKLKDEKKDITILVTGGFHTGNLSKLFKDNGYSYIEVMPKFDKTDVPCQYFKLLAGEGSKFDSVLRQAAHLAFNKSNIAIQSPFSEMGIADLQSNGISIQADILRRLKAHQEAQRADSNTKAFNYIIRGTNGAYIVFTDKETPSAQDGVSFNLPDLRLHAGVYVDGLPEVLQADADDVDIILLDGDTMQWDHQEVWIDKVGEGHTRDLTNWEFASITSSLLDRIGLSFEQAEFIMGHEIKAWTVPMPVDGHAGAHEIYLAEAEGNDPHCVSMAYALVHEVIGSYIYPPVDGREDPRNAAIHANNITATARGDQANQTISTTIQNLMDDVESGVRVRRAAGQNGDYAMQKEPVQLQEAMAEEIYRNWDKIKASGAFVFDVDGTLLERKEQDIGQFPELITSLSDLLKKGIPVVVASGGPRVGQTKRIALPLIERLRQEGHLDKIQNLIIYANGGSTKLMFNSLGEEDLSDPYNKRSEIPEHISAKVIDVLRQLARERFGLSEEVAVGWQEFYGAVGGYDKCTFKLPWTESQEYDPRLIKAEDTNGVIEAPWVEVRDGVQLSVKLFPKKYPNAQGVEIEHDIRGQVINAIREALGDEAVNYDIRTGGFGSIDIAASDVSKEKALNDLISSRRLNKEQIYYFGDEFFVKADKDGRVKPGNDMPIIPTGVNAVAVNKEAESVVPAARWIGPGPVAVGGLMSCLTSLISREEELPTVRIEPSSVEATIAEYLSQIETKGPDTLKAINPNAFDGAPAAIIQELTEKEWESRGPCDAVKGAANAVFKELGYNITMVYVKKVADESAMSAEYEQIMKQLSQQGVDKERIVAYVYTEAPDGKTVRRDYLKESGEKQNLYKVMYMKMQSIDGTNVATPIAANCLNGLAWLNRSSLEQKGADSDLLTMANQQIVDTLRLIGTIASAETIAAIMRGDSVSTIVVLVLLRPVDVNQISEFHRREAEVMRAL